MNVLDLAMLNVRS